MLRAGSSDASGSFLFTPERLLTFLILGLSLWGKSTLMHLLPDGCFVHFERLQRASVGFD